MVGEEEEGRGKGMGKEKRGNNIDDSGREPKNIFLFNVN